MRVFILLIGVLALSACGSAKNDEEPEGAILLVSIAY